MVLFSEVRQKQPLVEYLVQIGWVATSRKDGQLRGPCPLHQHTSRKKPRSFAVLVPDKWYCHKCKRGGDVIDLHAQLRGMTLREAAAELNGR